MKFTDVILKVLRTQKSYMTITITGSILTIETDSLKVCQKTKKDLNPNTTCWLEEKDKWRRDTLVLRVYYIKGEPALEEIGLFVRLFDWVLHHNDTVKVTWRKISDAPP
jgi:hypothetical protein